MKRLQKLETASILRLTFAAFTLAFFIAALIAPDRADMLGGFIRICTLPAQLTKDYFKPELGGLSASMLNTGLLSLICTALTLLPGTTVNGVTALAWFLTIGFGTFGMNPVNMLPLMLGTFVYARIRREPFARYIHFAMFSTGVAPIITQVLLYYPDAAAGPRVTPLGVALALGVGIFVGCAMPGLCAHSPGFHKGYNLYNAGPAAGFLCFLLYAVLYKTLGVEAPAIEASLGEGHPLFVNAFCGTMFALCVIAGLIVNGGPGDYKKLLLDPGFRVDFAQKYSAGSVLINLGVYGLFILLYYNVIGANFTGPTMGVVFCMVCCFAAGATPRNVLPIMLGYGAMGLLHRLGVTAFAVNSQALVVGLCYASGLAPIAGEYGLLAGVFAGILHYCLVTSVPAIHGGFNLYNGGFTSGIVAFLYVPVLEHYVKKRVES